MVFDQKHPKHLFLKGGSVFWEKNDPPTVAQNWESPKSENGFSELRVGGACIPIHFQPISIHFQLKTIISMDVVLIAVTALILLLNITAILYFK